MRKPELLVPASSLEVLKVAVIFGADAVYIGGEVFGLRAKAKNFSMGDMKEGVEFAHEHGVKVYVTANILAHNQDLEGVRAYFAELKRSGRMHSLFRIRECIGLRWKCARRLSGISVHRRIIRTMERISSGMNRGRSAS